MASERVLKAEFGHQDISIKIFGADLYGCNAISYKKKDAKKLHFGNAKQAVSFGNDGNLECTGEITILQSEYLGFISAMGGKSFVDSAPTDIIVNYSSSNSTQTVTDVLKGVLFNEEGKESKVGSSEMLVKLPFVCRNIIFSN